MKILEKLSSGDKVAILSPSFAAPVMFPYVFELGLQRIRDDFGLEPVEFPTTRKLGASTEERARDLISAFANPEIKAVIASIGGDDQVTYVYNMDPDIFKNNPKPFFGYSDNSHFCNFLFQQEIPSYYGACVMTQFAMQGHMDVYTVDHIKKALFEEGEIELLAAGEYNEVGVDWTDSSALTTRRQYEENTGFVWDGAKNAEGIIWGGCIESIDDMLRHNVQIPNLETFNSIVLILESSEEIPPHHYVKRVIRALGERKILECVQGILVGRPKAWEFDKQLDKDAREEYAQQQRDTILNEVRAYNQVIPIVQNCNFGHTDPQIPMPYGKKVVIDVENKKIKAIF
jgi:muramoyltetrapeptide carboxypeptidase LdcA involved in peptidoglycan recycling